MDNCRCLCCGKTILDSASDSERRSQWHTKCCKRFFATVEVPEIDITDDIINTIALETVSKGFTVAGVQKKISLHLSKIADGSKPRLTLVNYPVEYILKPQTEEYPNLPEAEFLVMSMAKVVGIKTVPFALLKQEKTLAYITKRVDRVKAGKDKKAGMLAMEDFCQLDGKLTESKYRGSYERCAKIVSQYSSRPGLDMAEFYLRIVFSFIVGNSDMHLKNFSMIETEEGSMTYVLSDAYDMLPVNMLLPKDEDQLALTLHGKTRNVTRNDFLLFADNCGISRKVAEGLILSIVKKKSSLINMCRESYLPEISKQSLENLILQRMSVFEK